MLKKAVWAKGSKSGSIVIYMTFGDGLPFALDVRLKIYHSCKMFLSLKVLFGCMNGVPFSAAAYRNYRDMFIILSLIILSTPWAAHAEMITVCKDGCDYVNIQEAIDAAVPGDIIEVQSGTYSENVNVTKQLTLRCVDISAKKPVVDAGQEGNAITISADGITLEGFNVTNSLGSGAEVWAGIKVTSTGNTITGNTAFNNENGILLAYFDNNTIKGNDAIHNIYGIRLKGSNDNEIATNNLSSNNYGIFLTSSDGNNIRGNDANSNDFGILLESSVGNVLGSNLMHENSYNFGANGDNDVDTSNLVGSKPIYYFVGVSGRVIDPSSNVGTIYCIDCNNLTVEGLTLGNNFHGIYLYNTTSSILKDNILSDNQYGIVLADSYNNTVMGNNVSNNGEDGIVLDSSEDNAIEGNYILENDGFGLSVTKSDYNSIISNNASRNEKGFFLFRSSHNQILMNCLAENSFGIHLKSSWINDVIDNKVVRNYNGVRLESSIENNVSGNEIIENGIGILYDSSSNNTLDDNLMLDNGKDGEHVITESVESGGPKPRYPVWINSSPSKADILIDGGYIGKSPLKDFFKPGIYTVELLKRGMKDESMIFEVPKTEVIVVNLTSRDSSE